MGDTIPRIADSAKNSADRISKILGIRGNSEEEKTHHSAPARMTSEESPPARKMVPKRRREAHLSAARPPTKYPVLIPASTTPIMPVRVYSDIPTCGAIMRSATSSRIRIAPLETNANSPGRLMVGRSLVHLD